MPKKIKPVMKSDTRHPKTGKRIRRKWYELDYKKHGVGGLSPYMPKPRKEDKRATPWEGYATVFFPQYKIGWKACIAFHETLETLSQTPEAARIKYADRIGGPDKPDKKWEQYSKAGHRVRRIRIIDLGPA